MMGGFGVEVVKSMVWEFGELDLRDNSWTGSLQLGAWHGSGDIYVGGL